MITLTAEIEINGANTSPFILGISSLGYSFFGENMLQTYLVNKRNVLSIDTETKDRGDIQLPNWGVISNGGSLSLKDKDARLLGFANAGVLVEGLPVTLFLENTLTKQRRQVGAYYTEKWSYDNDNRSVNVSFKDDLEEWQDINVEAIEYDPRKPDSKPMRFFYEYLHSKTPSKYNMMPFSMLDQETKDVLENIIVRYPMLEEGNLWSQWQKLCDSVGAYIYKNKNGETVFRYAKGS